MRYLLWLFAVLSRLKATKLLFGSAKNPEDTRRPCEIAQDECAADEDESSRPQSTLYDDIETMLYVSYLVQDIALFNHWDEIIGVEKLEDPDFFKTLPRTLSQVLQWFRLNIDLLRKAKSQTLRTMDPDFDLTGLEAIVVREQQHQGDDGHVEESTVEVLNDVFGFQGRDSKPVYAIARVPAKKRLVVVFRGSINPRDWEQDVKVQEAEVPISAEELSMIPNPNTEFLDNFTNVKIHSGFNEYLFEIKHNSTTKFDEICNEVLVLLKEPRNSGYSLYFTGHSLGAALATLAAVAMALSKDIDNTIKLITFASPHVGKSEFAQGFRELEKAGRIQHLRITNDDDVVPQGLGIFGYIHTGIHLNLSEEAHSLAASPQDEFSLSDVSFSHKWLLGNPSHLLQEHKKRLEKAKGELEMRTLQEIFEDPELQDMGVKEDESVLK